MCYDAIAIPHVFKSSEEIAFLQGNYMAEI